MTTLQDATDGMLIREMVRRGYRVRHASESRDPLSWNRVAPFPQGVDFKAEAVERIKGMITADMLEFSTREQPSFGPGGKRTTETVHTARLLIL